jgi:hypothetical protein
MAVAGTGSAADALSAGLDASVKPRAASMRGQHDEGRQQHHRTLVTDVGSVTSQEDAVQLLPFQPHPIESRSEFDGANPQLGWTPPHSDTPPSLSGPLRPY